LGNITNSNAAFLSRELAGIGVAVFRHTSVGDNHERLRRAMESAFENADIVITTGGLGPTQDDITKTVAAEFFGLQLEIHEESKLRILKRFAGRNLPESVERNALVPAGAMVFANENGSAPGICLENCGRILIMLPGPPHEMQPMFLRHGLDFLRKKTDRVFVSRTLKMTGIGETAVEAALQDIIDAQTNPTIAPYAKVGEVHVRITASGADTAAANALLLPTADEIYSRLGEKIYGEDDVPLAETVLQLLRCGGHSLAVAESCTGGLIAAEIVSVAGSSDIFCEGFVTYSNEAKTARILVAAEILAAHGAVSAETAAAMAIGAAKTAGASVAISTTGIAGPGGGTAEKPVGLVYVGLFIAGHGTFTSRFNLIGGRNEIRRCATILALDFLRRTVGGTP